MVSNHIIEAYIKSTSDTSPKWEDIRSGADMNELYAMPCLKNMSMTKILDRISGSNSDDKLLKEQ